MRFSRRRATSGFVRSRPLCFRRNPAASFAAAAPWRALSEMLHLSYLCYYPIIYGPLLILYFQRRREAFRATGFAVALTYYCCYSIFVLYPVRGPWDLWPLSEAQPDGPFRSIAVRILEAGSSTGAAFPSSHQAVAVVQTVLRGSRTATAGANHRSAERRHRPRRSLRFVPLCGGDDRRSPARDRDRSRGSALRSARAFEHERARVIRGREREAHGNRVTVPQVDRT